MRPDFTSWADKRLLDRRDVALRRMRSALIVMDEDLDGAFDAVLSTAHYLTEQERALLVVGLLRSLPHEIAEQAASDLLSGCGAPFLSGNKKSLRDEARKWVQSAAELEVRAVIAEGLKRISRPARDQIRKALK